MHEVCPSLPRSHCAMPSHPHPLVTARGFMCMWLPRRPSTVSSLQSLSHRLMYSPSTPSPSPSFMMETDTNTVIGFRDKLFTLPMLSAAVSRLRGRPLYKWPLFLDLILLIDPWQRQYMCDWESGEDCTVKVQRIMLWPGWCVLSGCWQPVLRGIRCLKIYCLVNEMAVHRLQRRHINRAQA